MHQVVHVPQERLATAAERMVFPRVHVTGVVERIIANRGKTASSLTHGGEKSLVMTETPARGGTMTGAMVDQTREGQTTEGTGEMGRGLVLGHDRHHTGREMITELTGEDHGRDLPLVNERSSVLIRFVSFCKDPYIHL